MSINEDGLTKICLDYLYLQEELNCKQVILNDMYDEIQGMLKNENVYDMINDSIEVNKFIELSESFNTKRFQKDHKDLYEECREEKKRFNSNLVKKNYPKWYEKYLTQKHTLHLSIKRTDENGRKQ